MEGSPEQPPEQQPEPQQPMAQVTEESVPIDCQNCKQHFNFPVEPHINGFKFQCTSCGAWTEWKRQV